MKFPDALQIETVENPQIYFIAKSIILLYSSFLQYLIKNAVGSRSNFGCLPMIYIDHLNTLKWRFVNSKWRI